jgi:hypothetical protein
MTTPSGELNLLACDCRFMLRCSSADTASLIASVFGGLATAPTTDAAHREYSIEGTARGPFGVSSLGTALVLHTVDELLFHLDKSITIDLQHLRPDLLFVHGAGLACGGRVAVLSAPPGTGKSTLTLVARQFGLEFFSDELAPIDLHQLTVYPYPRATYLKSRPPPPHSLPSSAIDHGGRYHVPLLPGAAPRDSAAVGALIFLRRGHERLTGLQPISAASGATQLIANTLNLLAHPAAGIDAAVALSRAVRCFELDTTDLLAASEAVQALLQPDRAI